MCVCGCKDGNDFRTPDMELLVIFNNVSLIKITSIHLLSKQLCSTYSIPGTALSVVAIKRSQSECVSEIPFHL